MKKRFIMSPSGRKRSIKASRTMNTKRLVGIKGSKNRIKRKAVTAAKVCTNGFSNYTPWSGAKDTWDNLERFDKLDELESYIDEVYYNADFGEGLIKDTELNDLLWFEPETVYEAVGLYYNIDTDEVSDEPFDDEEDY